MTGRAEPTVLVVGAGPTGLTMAAQLHAHGARVRIIERRRERRHSRAFIMHPRTLEVLAPLGVVEALIARGDRSTRATVRAGGRHASVRLARAGIDDTSYPFLLAIPQVAVEEVLEQRLREAGVPVEREVELRWLTQRRDRVECHLREAAGRRRRVEADYVVGCDGGDSTVRRAVGIPFPGRAYRPTLLMANLDADGPLEPGAVNGYVGTDGLLFLFPSVEAAPWRMLTVGTRPRRDGTGEGAGDGAGDGSDGASLRTLQAAADRFTGGRLRLRDLAWSTTIRLRRGQASRYWLGRVLLAGDAAHQHSPAGAQGMNTGIQDACNLGWKLALVTQGYAGPELLWSYQAERWPVARRVRHLTDLVFLAEAGDLPPLGWLRRYLVPAALPVVDGATLPAWAFRVLGGLTIGYRRSLLVGQAHPPVRRAIRPGERLPDGWVVHEGNRIRLHQALRTPGFHLLLCGPPGSFDEAAVAALGGRGLPLTVHRLARHPAPGVLADPDGTVRDRLGGDTAVYLVRPDGYVGFRSGGADVTGLARHLRVYFSAAADLRMGTWGMPSSTKAGPVGRNP